MPFQPQALDERTLKKFVDRLLKSQQGEPTVSRSTAQEHVARMLGFQHWHQALAAIRSPRPGNPLVHKSTGGPGFYPAEPKEFTRDHSEALIRWVLQTPFSSDLTVQTGEQAFLESLGRNHRVTRRFWTTEECLSFAQALGAAPDVVRSERTQQQGADWAHTLTLADGERYRIVASLTPITTAGSKGFCVNMRIHASIPPALDTLGYTAEQIEQLRKFSASPGLTLIASHSGGGKSTTLAALLREQVEQPNTQAVVLDAPLEFEYEAISTGPNSTLQAIDLQVSELTAASQVRKSLKSKPSYVSVGIARDQATFQEAVYAANQGHRVSVGLHSDSVPDALTRPLRGWGDQWRQQGFQLIHALNTVMAQKLETTGDGKRVALREWMEITPQVRQTFVRLMNEEARDPIHLRTLLETVLDEHGHSFTEDIERLASSKVLPPDALEQHLRYRRLRKSS